MSIFALEAKCRTMEAYYGERQKKNLNCAAGIDCHYVEQGGLHKLVNAHPLFISGVRSMISAVIILLYVRKPKITWSFPQIAAAMAYALTVISFVIANKYTTAANAILFSILLLFMWRFSADGC